MVFKGKFEGKEVAVKRTQLVDMVVTLSQEIDILRSRMQHQNVVGFLHCEEDANYK